MGGVTLVRRRRAARLPRATHDEAPRVEGLLQVAIVNTDPLQVSNLEQDVRLVVSSILHEDQPY